MSSIFELGYRFILPSLRRGLVLELVRIGASQKEVSNFLRMSHSAVSRYISSERGSILDLSTHKDIMRELNRLAVKIKSEGLSYDEIMKNLYRLVVVIMARKYVCNLHAKLDPKINPRECTICPSIFHEYIY